jgi:hypothetical protein
MEPKTVRRGTGQPPLRPDTVSCITNALVAGTEVLTLDGALPVDVLGPGDRVITRDSGMATLIEVRHRRLERDVVRIRAGSLGNARPDRDVLMSATQEVLIRDWRAMALFGRQQALIPVSRLVDGEFVHHAGRADVVLVELIFDAPHILYADGLEVAAAQPISQIA